MAVALQGRPKGLEVQLLHLWSTCWLSRLLSWPVHGHESFSLTSQRPAALVAEGYLVRGLARARLVVSGTLVGRPGSAGRFRGSFCKFSYDRPLGRQRL